MNRARGNGGHRRPSGSDSAGRRVLADIEWWRVVDGQCLADPGHDDEDVGPADRDPDQVPLHISESSPPPQYSEVDTSFVPVTWDASLAESSEVCELDFALLTT